MSWTLPTWVTCLDFVILMMMIMMQKYIIYKVCVLSALRLCGNSYSIWPVKTLLKQSLVIFSTMRLWGMWSNMLCAWKMDQFNKKTEKIGACGYWICRCGNSGWADMGCCSSSIVVSDTGWQTYWQESAHTTGNAVAGVSIVSTGSLVLLKLFASRLVCGFQHAFRLYDELQCRSALHYWSKYVNHRMIGNVMYHNASNISQI